MKCLFFTLHEITAKGNITPTAEYNFYCDPEAAHAVMSKTGRPIKLLTWEVAITACGVQWVRIF